MTDTVSAEFKAAHQNGGRQRGPYPTQPATIITRDEIERINDALNIGAEQARRLRHEIDVQTARADVAEAALRASNGRVATMERRIREARGIIEQLSAIAALSIYADAALWRQCCNSDVPGPHADDCPVKRAEEWLG